MADLQSAAFAARLPTNIFLFSFTYLICLIFPFFFQLTVSQTSFSKFLLYPLEQESSVTFVCLTFLLYSFRLDRIFVLHSLLYQDRLYTFSLFFVIICFTSILSLCSMPSRLRFNADYCELAVCEGGSFNFSYYWICHSDITVKLWVRSCPGSSLYPGGSSTGTISAVPYTLLLCMPFIAFNKGFY